MHHLSDRSTQARPTRGARVLAVSVVVLLIAAVASLAIEDGASDAVLLRDRFDGEAGLIASEHEDLSDRWILTSGSLFNRDDRAWTGEPGPETGSAVFRMVSARDDLGDVVVSLQFTTHDLVSTERTPPQAWDGVHVFLRYQSPEDHYVVSFNRRDDTLAIKKKQAGLYYSLAVTERAVPEDEPIQVQARVINRDDGVEIRLAIDGEVVLSAVDTGETGEPITAPGRVGIRTDNANVTFDDLVVEAVAD